MKKPGKTLFALVMILIVMLAGCGSREVVMKEFTSGDGTVSVSMNESWTPESMGTDAGSEGWIAAFNEDESEGIIIMQIAKETYGANVAGINEWQELIETSYSMSDMEEINKPSIEGMEVAEAYSCKVIAGGITSAGYVVFGETDYGFYCILYAAPKRSAKNTEYFNNVCGSFRENAPMPISMGRSIYGN